MIEAAFVDQAVASPLASIHKPIDLTHLARMTLGDTSLEREVLQLFDRQAEMLVGRMRRDPANAAGYAHTLKGSSSGIGAWKVARAAAAVELASGRAMDAAAAIENLGAAINETRAVIAELLRAH
jgi:HPt (histidine-containing phosphotransfer) domain-containing protein